MDADLIYDEEYETAEEAPPPFYTVAIFLVDRAYGGPEEGGWYYNCGVPTTDVELADDMHLPRIFKSVFVAREHARMVNEALEPINKERPDIGSVLSQGRYFAEICDGYPKPYPETRPHYE